MADKVKIIDGDPEEELSPEGDRIKALRIDADEWTSLLKQESPGARTPEEVADIPQVAVVMMVQLDVVPSILATLETCPVGTMGLVGDGNVELHFITESVFTMEEGLAFMRQRAKEQRRGH